jgi:hypothetical protein
LLVPEDGVVGAISAWHSGWVGVPGGQTAYGWVDGVVE